MASADLLTLQANIKRDVEGYKDEFMLQYRHYQAELDVFKLRPSNNSKEFSDLVQFIAQVSKCYPRSTAGFAPQLMELLETHALLLDPTLRRSLVQSLILLRNRGQVAPATVLPLFFKLFRCQDKLLRQMLFRHIVSDIKNSNKKHRNEKLNRQLQNFMYGVIADDNEAAAKKSLAVCTELWRRHVWRDARTVNVIASAAQHKSSRIMLAAIKFFLGQDQKGDDDEDGEAFSEDEGEAAKAKGPTKEDIYKAHNQGTRSSKKKKIAKLKRVMNTVKKQTRKVNDAQHESFAALHLLHDPQAFVERLFARLQGGNERFETRMAMISVISRVIGVHKLLLLNFYPFLQKYCAPHTRDVTVVLAALVGAAHELVPPETLSPVLRQLVDQFVHDRARPEVVTVGLKTVRELCLRCPLVMSADLLGDLVLYKKYKDKEVSAAARSLVSLFRELNPAMLARKDRGRGADMEAAPKAYGQVDVAERVDGADLLEEALREGRGSSDDELHLSSDDEDDSDLVDLDGSDIELESLDGEGEEGEDSEEEGEDGDDDEEQEDEGEEEEGSSDDEGAFLSGDDAAGSLDGDEDEEEDGPSTSGSDSEEEDQRRRKGQKQQTKKQQLPQQQDSISALKKKLAAAKAAKEKAEEQPGQGGEAGSGPLAAPPAGVRIEMDRILTEEDFERIRRLKQRRLIESALSKHGLKGASAAKKRRLLEAAEAEAEEAEALKSQLRAGAASEARVAPEALQSKKKRSHDKEARMASVLAGREGRDKFGSSTGRKQKKTGGLSEKEKQRKKSMPLAARLSQLKRRHQTTSTKRRFKKNFKGRVRG